MTVYVFQFLSEWKSKTKKKARIAKNSLIKTGGGSYNIDELTEIENRLLKVLGWVSIVGCEGLPPEIDPDCGYVRAGNIDEEIVFENDHDEDYNNEIIEEIIILPMENENEPQNLVPTDHPERKFSKGTCVNYCIMFFIISKISNIMRNVFIIMKNTFQLF